VFISNGGGDRLETLGETALDGGPDRAYNEFYSAMQSWGRYKLVSSPSDADVVFQISCVIGATGLRLPELEVGQLRLVVLDSKTAVPLWTIREYVRGAALLGNRDKNFEQALNMVMTRLKGLSDSDKSGQ